MNSSSSSPSSIVGLIDVDVADEAELGVAGRGADQAGVLAGHADGEGPWTLIARRAAG